MKALGIDIGTTSICLVCRDEAGGILESLSCPNLFLDGTYMQDADVIFEKVQEMLGELTVSKKELSAIGISSQMHGILYVDGQGRAVTPYYTWKDESGNKSFRHDLTFCGYLSKAAGLPIFSGYGTATHFYMQKNGLIPKEAVRFCNIGDYIVMRLVKTRTPLTDATVAASFGGYDLKSRTFRLERLADAGVDIRYYPGLAEEGETAGYYDGIPVFCAVGDNQASFYGALGEDETAVGINVGTGSQVSMYESRLLELQNAETRPYLNGGYLYVGASLNGGKAYERLAAFWQEAFSLAGLRTDVYDWMERTGMEKEDTSLFVEPALYGARGKAGICGAVGNLTADNFHPSDFIRAWVKGMARELHELYEAFPQELKGSRDKIVASGNGIRKNRLLRQEIEKLFGMPLVLKETKEEAAAGAALLAYRFFIRQERNFPAV